VAGGLAPVVKAVAQVFNLRPPAKKTSGFKLWIKAGRELLDACLPHTPAEVLVEIQREYTINLHLGRRVYDVCGPQSLVNEARRVAGQMSARSVFVDRLDEDPVTEVDEFVACPRCNKLVYPERVEDNCRGH